MKKLILGILLAATCVSGATAGHYKPNHSQKGYDQTYQKLRELATGCGSVALVPVIGTSSCAGAVLANVNKPLLKTHMKKEWRGHVKRLGIATAATSVIAGVQNAEAFALYGLLTSAAQELRDEMGARS